MRIGVEEVQIGQLLAAVLDHAVPPRAPTGYPVAGTALVRVLAVAKGLRTLQGEMDGLG